MSTVRRQIIIDAPARSVWNKIATAEGLRSWLADDARVDERQGGRLVLKVRTPNGAAEETGMFHVYRPTGRLEVIWDRVSPGPWKGSTLSFQVARSGQETVLNVQHSNSAYEDANAYGLADAAWKNALDRIRSQLES